MPRNLPQVSRVSRGTFSPHQPTYPWTEPERKENISLSVGPSGVVGPWRVGFYAVPRGPTMRGCRVSSRLRSGFVAAPGRDRPMRNAAWRTLVPEPGTESHALYTVCVRCGKVCDGHMTDTSPVVHMTGSVSRAATAARCRRRWSGPARGATREKNRREVIHTRVWITLWTHTHCDVDGAVDDRVDKSVRPRDQGAS